MSLATVRGQFPQVREVRLRPTRETSGNKRRGQFRLFAILRRAEIEQSTDAAPLRMTLVPGEPQYAGNQRTRQQTAPGIRVVSGGRGRPGGIGAHGGWRQWS